MYATIELHENLRRNLVVGVAIFVSVLILVLFVSANFLHINPFQRNQPNVLAENVNVTGAVYSCILDLTIYPEKRQPATNNWQTDLTIEFYDDLETTLLGTATGTSDSAGNMVINICDQGVQLIEGDYLLKIRGKSHLFKDFLQPNTFDTTTEVINLTAPADRLLAGETSPVFDNYINTLDLTTQIYNFDTNDDTNDLNQDGEVNSLDFSNTIYNFYETGE